MAVKARETLQSKQFGILTIVIVAVLVLGYTFLYNRIINTLESYELRTAIGIVSLAILIITFIVSLRFTATKYEMTVTHNRLNIVQKILFWRKEMEDINLADVTQLVFLENASKVEGRTKNYTLAEMEGKRKYALIFKEQGKTNCVKIQCSGKSLTA